MVFLSNSFSSASLVGVKKRQTASAPYFVLISDNTTTLFCIKRLSNYNPVDFNLIEAKVMDVGTQQKHNKKGPQPLLMITILPYCLLRIKLSYPFRLHNSHSFLCR